MEPTKTYTGQKEYAKTEPEKDTFMEWFRSALKDPKLGYQPSQEHSNELFKKILAEIDKQ